MADELHGLGTKFLRWNADALPSPIFEQMCNITSISGPGYAKDTLETTDLCTVDAYRTFMAGLKDAGEVSLAVNYATAVWALLYADFEAAVNNNYQIVLPDNTTLEFAGLITAVPLEVPMDEKITSEVTIKISGKPVIS